MDRHRKEAARVNKEGRPIGHNQTREVVAAHSATEARTIAGMTRGDWEHRCGGETGNTVEISIASTKPGTIFWQPLDPDVEEREVWREAEPKKVD